MIEEEVFKAVIADMQNCFKWNDANFSSTRDVFTARIQSYILETKKYLEAAIIGEIGNNTFDHNFIFENDCPRGAYCDLSYRQKYMVLADYGKGIKGSLISVLPSIGSDLQAIEAAFTKRVSGRFPEQRGNGLKFVSRVIQENNWHLYFHSGTGFCSIDRAGIKFFKSPISLTGCLAIINFSGEN